MAAKGSAVGIDLGTTYSCVGIFQHGKVEIIANDQVSLSFFGRNTLLIISFYRVTEQPHHMLLLLTLNV